jgi:hypothetical protein
MLTAAERRMARIRLDYSKIGGSHPRAQLQAQALVLQMIEYCERRLAAPNKKIRIPPLLTKINLDELLKGYVQGYFVDAMYIGGGHGLLILDLAFLPLEYVPRPHTWFRITLLPMGHIQTVEQKAP